MRRRRHVIVPVFLLLAFLAAPTAAPAQENRVAVGDRVTGSFAEGAEPVRYTLEVPPDSFLFGEVDQISVDVVIRFFDPEGEAIGEIDGPARGPERFVRRLEDGGSYQIEVAPFEGATGDYALTIYRLEPLRRSRRGSPSS